MYFIIGEVDGYIECISIEEKDGNKYINFASIDKNKEVLWKYTDLWLKKQMINHAKIEKVAWESNLVQMVICL